MIPIGKALVAVEVEDYDCSKCFFVVRGDCMKPEFFPKCISENGKEIIYKLIDLPVKSYAERFLYWLENSTAFIDMEKNGKIDIKLLKELFNAMDEDDK